MKKEIKQKNQAQKILSRYKRNETIRKYAYEECCATRKTECEYRGEIAEINLYYIFGDKSVIVRTENQWGLFFTEVSFENMSRNVEYYNDLMTSEI